MKPVLVFIVGCILLSGCAVEDKPEPEPSKTSTLTLQECAKMTFDMLKETRGVAYLSDQKEEATAFVTDTCKGLPSE